MADRPTFSQSWNRVAKLTPTLRPQVTIERQLFRGEPWHVVHDPVTNQFFRLNPVAYHLVGLFDGKRNVDQVWGMTLERFGDDAPTQGEVIGLLSQLTGSNLLRVDLPADAEPLIRRQQQRKYRQWSQQAMSLLYLKIPIFNPNRMLNWLSPLARPMLSKWGMIAWCTWLIICLWQFLPEVPRFAKDASSVLDPSNWAWMMVMFLLIKAWHELGHGLMCKRFGGAVPEVGIMLMVLMPAPFVDATSAWNFPDKRHRILVGAAGMIFELAAAGIAALVWIHSEPNTLTRQLSYNCVFLASVTTIIFNANPLMRFDGYYMLSDWLEIPNLADRSLRHLRWLAQRFMFGMEQAQGVASTMFEQYALTIYGVLSLAYRILVVMSIALILAERLPVIGMIIGVWTAFSYTILPVGKLVHWLATSDQLTDTRGRAVGVSMATAAILIGSLGIFPFPEHHRAQGIVESAVRSDITIMSDGFVKEVLVESGQYVTRGQVILIAENPDLEDRRNSMVANLHKAQFALRQSFSKDPVEIKMARARADALNEELEKIDEKLRDLTIRSPQDGVVAAGIMKQLTGQFLKHGKVVGMVEDLNHLRVTALVDQASNDSLFNEHNKINRVELRTAGKVDRILQSSVIQAAPAGKQRLPHPALSSGAGGNVSTDPKDQHGMMAVRPQFEFWLNLPASKTFDVDHTTGPLSISDLDQYPGQRVYVRFTMEHYRPLLFQWIHMARQVLRDRLSV